MSPRARTRARKQIREGCQGSRPRAEQERKVSDEENNRDVVEQVDISKAGSQLDDSPERECGHENRARHEVAVVTVMRQREREIRAGREKEGRSL